MTPETKLESTGRGFHERFQQKDTQSATSKMQRAKFIKKAHVTIVEELKFRIGPDTMSGVPEINIVQSRSQACLQATTEIFSDQMEIIELKSDGYEFVCRFFEVVVNFQFCVHS